MSNVESLTVSTKTSISLNCDATDTKTPYPGQNVPIFPSPRPADTQKLLEGGTYRPKQLWMSWNSPPKIFIITGTHTFLVKLNKHKQKPTKFVYQPQKKPHTNAERKPYQKASFTALPTAQWIWSSVHIIEARNWN